MVLANVILTISELMVLFFQLGNFFSRKKDKTRLRFLILTAAFVLYNLTCGFSYFSQGVVSPFFSVSIVMASGIFLGIYYFHYVMSELNIKQKGVYRLQSFTLSLLGSYVIGFLITYIVSKDLQVSYRVFAVLPSIATIYFSAMTVRSIWGTRKRLYWRSRNRIMFFFSLTGIVLIGVVPFSLIFEDFQLIGNLLINLSYFSILIVYLNYYYYRIRMENDFLEQQGCVSNQHIDEELRLYFLDDFKDLNIREKQVAQFLLLGFKHKEIGKRLIISEQTSSSYASRMYKKVGCKDCEELRQKIARKNPELP